MAGLRPILSCEPTLKGLIGLLFFAMLFQLAREVDL